MTSLEEARQQVINAAREWREVIDSQRYLMAEAVALIDAVDALDALERPVGVATRSEGADANS